jgi:hypothetical protein
MPSCSCDMEVYDPFVSREQFARKEHVCCDCGGIIRKGERYLVHGGAFDGNWEMHNRCPDCQFLVHEVGRTFMAECGGWPCVYVGDLSLSWDELWYDTEPEHAAEIRRIVGMQHALCDARDGSRKWSLPGWVEDMCTKCNGSGCIASPDGDALDCDVCDGMGEI